MSRATRGTSKDPCLVATTAAITLAAAQTIDGVAVGDGNRVLVKDQAAAATNGIYVCRAGNWERADDFDHVNNVLSGSEVYISQGTVNGGMYYRLSTTGVIVVGTTALTFVSSTQTTDIEITVPFLQGFADAGTFTPAVAAGLETLTETAVGAAHSWWSSIPLASATSTARGFTPTGLKVAYENNGTAPEDVRFEVWKVTQNATGTAPTAAVLFGETGGVGGDYPAAYDTAAERGAVAGTGEHTYTITDAGTPVLVDAGETLLLRIYSDGDAVPTSVLIVKSVILLGTLT